MTIILKQFSAGFGIPNPSPFCMKGEILLKMAGLEYKSIILDDPRKSPKGKLPYIEDEGNIIADTALIQRYLETKYDVNFDSNLFDVEKATAHAFA